mmetsp:Transcript_16833/g.30111  ORF Transcript_16833/g.30111 Transcript_16833/m.30111 type:complete len:267 (-) Transcript_16833:196-996(-)
MVRACGGAVPNEARLPRFRQPPASCAASSKRPGVNVTFPWLVGVLAPYTSVRAPPVKGICRDGGSEARRCSQLAPLKSVAEQSQVKAPSVGVPSTHTPPCWQPTPPGPLAGREQSASGVSQLSPWCPVPAQLQPKAPSRGTRSTQWPWCWQAAALGPLAATSQSARVASSANSAVRTPVPTCTRKQAPVTQGKAVTARKGGRAAALRAAVSRNTRTSDCTAVPAVCHRARRNVRPLPCVMTSGSVANCPPRRLPAAMAPTTAEGAP